GAAGDGSLEALERLASEFPNASVTGPALQRLAAVHAQAGRYGAAAEAYRRLLRRDGADEGKAQALVGLAGAFQRRGARPAARDAWQRPAGELGARVLAVVGRDQPVRDVVAQELQKPEYREADTPSRPNPAPPLRQAWQVALREATGSERLLVPERTAGDGL